MGGRRDGGKEKNQNAFLTTHQAAKLLGVSLPTVVNWIEAGRIHAHRTPGRHRRIAREELLRFSQVFNYPLPADFVRSDSPSRILVIEGDQDLGEMICDYLIDRDGYDVRYAGDPFEAGFVMGRFQPQLVLLDVTLPGLDPYRALRLIRDGESEDKQPIVFACSALRDLRSTPALRDFDGQIDKPIDWTQLRETLREALST